MKVSYFSPLAGLLENTAKPKYMNIHSSERCHMSRPRFVMCVCTGECPGFKDLNVWQLLNYVRNELDVEYAIVHPQLCVDDGDRFWRDVAKAGVHYVVGACDPRMQRKMFSQSFKESGCDFDGQVVSLDLRGISTEAAIEKVRDAVQKLRE
jgi:heterodisulfide reductase subunit A-like polyferredoxin